MGTRPARLLRLAPVLAAGARELLDALYPPLCPLCGALAGADGLPCGHGLPDPVRGPPGPRCGRCARALPPMLEDGDRCAACRRRAPAFRRLVALGDYRRDEGLRAWLLALKHGGRRDLVPTLARHLARRLEAVSDPHVLLVPVPLHPLRRMERGFDQATLLARAVADELDAPCRSLLVRRRWTPPQGTLGSRSRTANVREAFRPRRGRPTDLFGVPVWLVDDVVTSGATAEACVRELRALGARRVSVLALARAGDEGTVAEREPP